MHAGLYHERCPYVAHRHDAKMQCMSGIFLINDTSGSPAIFRILERTCVESASQDAPDGGLCLQRCTASRSGTATPAGTVSSVAAPQPQATMSSTTASAPSITARQACSAGFGQGLEVLHIRLDAQHTEGCKARAGQK